MRAAAAGSEILSHEAASARPGGAVAVSAHTPTLGYRAVIATRALLATSNSFRSFDVWREALVGEETAALESAWHCRRLVMTMAHFERTVVTHAVLQEGTFSVYKQMEKVVFTRSKSAHVFGPCRWRCGNCTPCTGCPRDGWRSWVHVGPGLSIGSLGCKNFRAT